jgi:hypothetical protein
VRRPEFRALKVVRGRHRSPHARGAPFGWARTASNSHLLGAWPTPADQGGPSGDSAGLTGLSETKRVRHRRPARTELAPSRAVPHRRDNAPRRTPVSTRVTGTGPFTLRLAKRCGLKRVVCYPCYAFKVCWPCRVGPGAGGNPTVSSPPTTKLQAVASYMLALGGLAATAH